jgi:hypothetical protein
MEETIGINLELPKEFSIKLDRYLIDLKEFGVKKTKAQLIINLAELGLLTEKREIEIRKVNK